MSTTNRLSCISLLLSAALMTSACGDGETESAHGVRYELRAVTFGEGRFVAVGYEQDTYQGELVTSSHRPILTSSTDGVSWTRHDASLPPFPLHQIVFGNGAFVALGSKSENDQFMPILLFSDDGVTWSRVTVPGARTLMFGGGLFVIIDTERRIHVSTDGQSFTVAAEISDLPGSSGRGVGYFTYGAGHFVGWGHAPFLSVTTDLQTYTDTLLSMDAVDCLHFMGGRFKGIGVKESGSDIRPDRDPFILTSDTGETWSTTLGDFPCRGLAESNGVFVGARRAGDGLGNELFRSPDGEAFRVTHVAEEEHERIDVAAGGGLFVAVGVDEIDTSPDGETWTVTPIPR